MPEDSQPPRMLGYVRVSTEEQATSGLGMADQRKALEQEADRRGWQIEIVVDAGQSGSTLERPGLKTALEQLARREADGLIVAKLDRLSRSVIDFGLLLEWFDEIGARLVALDLGVDSSTAGGRLVANVFAAVAEWERDTIRERTRRALGALRAQGRPTGRPSVADRPVLVERIQELRGRGWSLQRIADQLNADGEPTLRGADRWQKSAVQRICGYERPKPRRKHAELPRAARRGSAG
jgi:DNA invertase Pin-like site-specific DNA recombinase